MYVKSLPTATGVAVLPATGSNRALFIAAVGLIVAGVAIMVAAAVMARKSRKSAAQA